MAFTEADYTNYIESISNQLIRYKKNNSFLIFSGFFRQDDSLGSREDINELIDYILYAPEGHYPSYDSICERYKNKTQQSISRDCDPKDKEKLAYLMQVHFTAIKDGLSLAKYADSSPREFQSIPIQVNHVHHCHHNSTFTDFLIWDYIFNHNTSSSHSRTDKNDGPSAASILLLILMAGSAAVASLYTVVQTLRSFDEVIHGENTWQNIAKLGAVGALATGGVFLGFLIGASTFQMPVLGGVLMAAIVAGVSYKAINLIQTNCTKSENNGSAIDGDNRFCLSAKEWGRLKNKGLNPYVTTEAIRALAIEMKKTQANSLLFLSDASFKRKELINQLRNLKQGKIDYISIGQKTFRLTDKITPIALPEEINPPSYNQVDNDGSFSYQKNLPSYNTLFNDENAQQNDTPPPYESICSNQPLGQPTNSAFENASAPPQQKVA